MAVLKLFGHNILDGKKVHSLFNVMTMQHDVYDFFYCLRLWFEKTVVILGTCLETKNS
jgi:hypothetical protein